MVRDPSQRAFGAIVRYRRRTLNARSTLRRVVWAVVVACLTGCAAPTVYVSPHLGSVGRIAVLPTANETNDLDGPVFVRQLIYDHLAQRGAALVPIAKVDETLNANGFTDGGQLRAAKPEDMGQWLGVDTLFYVTLADFGYINVGFYFQRKVNIVGRLVDAKTGERLWEAERGWATRWLVTLGGRWGAWAWA